jgi:SAM-dependent methyltransferase
LTIDAWLQALEERYLADLTFAEIARALRALSSTYVERRQRLAEGAVFDGAGKRAAFALFYAPIHFLLVQRIVSAIGPAGRGSKATLVDLGCGTGAAGAAWASTRGDRHAVLGIDRHPWPLAEAARTYRLFGLKGATRRANLADVRLPAGPSDFLTAFTLNELADPVRDRLLDQLMARARRGDRLLVIEPLARSVSPWWDAWRDKIVAAGGRSDEWRFQTELPAVVRKLDRAAGLNHRELTARSLWLDTIE